VRAGRELFALLLAVAEALLADRALSLVDLRGVFAGLESEERVHGGSQRLGEVAVEVAEERVVRWERSAGSARRNTTQASFRRQPGLAEGGRLLETRGPNGRRAQKRRDEGVEVLRT
jgi:hypothetical protein